MKILMLLGSPRPEGTTAVLADAFRKGAEESGNHVEEISCAKLHIHPCIGCGNCHRHGVCVWTDDMPKVEKKVLESDVLVYVTPVYYAGVTAQLKTVMDRFYSFNSKFREKRPRLALITAAHEKVLSSTSVVVAQYEELLRYFPAEDLGRVNALGTGGPEDLEGTGYTEEAYALGCSIKNRRRILCAHQRPILKKPSRNTMPRSTASNPKGIRQNFWMRTSTADASCPCSIP